MVDTCSKRNKREEEETAHVLKGTKLVCLSRIDNSFARRYDFTALCDCNRKWRVRRHRNRPTEATRGIDEGKGMQVDIDKYTPTFVENKSNE